MIVVQNVAKSFGELRIFEGLSFRVEQGEFVCIFGPSGCGKTTLLRILAALDPPDKGGVFVNGLDATLQRAEYIKKISFVWQDPRLLPWRTGLQNVMLALELQRGTRASKEAREAANGALEFVGLKEFKNSLPRFLSGGMRQRVNLARALALDSEVMLMDEPLASLNEITEKRTLMNEITKLWEAKKKSIVYVTHSLNEAVFLADRIIVFSEKPATILASVTVNLNRPRDVNLPQAAELRKKVTDLFDYGLI